jgi:heme A synthase
VDRRAVFFLGAALVCFALAPIGLQEHRHIAVVVGVVYLVLALLSLLDSRSRSSSTRRRPGR